MKEGIKVGIHEWWKARKERKNWIVFAECEFARLSLLELKQNLKLQRLQYKILKNEEKRLKRKPDYVR